MNQSKGKGKFQNFQNKLGGAAKSAQMVRIPNKIPSKRPVTVVVNEKVRNRPLRDYFPTGKGNSGPSRRVVRCVEDEYIGEVFGSVSFSTTSYAFNPGLTTSFPRLSLEAALYEKYRVISAQPYYKPEVSGFATNGQSGKVMLSFNYNALAPLPVSKQQVEDTFPHADCMPYEDILLTLNPALLNADKSGKYVRTGAAPVGGDLKTYDGGQLFVSTYGNAATTVIGELRVRYIIELEIPLLQYSTNLTQQLHYSTLTGQSADPFQNGSLSPGSNINATASGEVFTMTNLIPGTAYEVELVTESTQIATAPTLSITSGAVALNELDGNTLSTYSAFVTDVGGIILSRFIAEASTVVLNATAGGGISAGEAVVDFFVTAFSSLLGRTMIDKHNKIHLKMEQRQQRAQENRLSVLEKYVLELRSSMTEESYIRVVQSLTDVDAHKSAVAKPPKTSLP